MARVLEKLAFDCPPCPPSGVAAGALDRIFRLIFLFAGVSYYKAFIPEH